MPRRFTYECPECGEFDTILCFGEPVPPSSECKCGRTAERRIKFPQSHSDLPPRRLSSLLPFNYTHKTRGQVMVVEGNAGLRETLKRYNGTYNKELEV